MRAKGKGAEARVSHCTPASWFVRPKTRKKCTFSAGFSQTPLIRNVNISTTFGRWRDQHSQKIVLLPIASKFGPQEVNRFSQLCAKFQALGSFELHATIFSNLVKMALPSGRILSRLLRRMKAFIDEFRPNTSQANYFGGFWRITSEINAKIEVIKQ